MRIGIDLRFTATSDMGTGSYAEQAALALGHAASPDDTLVGLTDGDPFSGALAKRIEYRRVPSSATGWDHHVGQRVLWDSAIIRAELDVFFAPTGIAPAVATCPTVITIHDLLFASRPDWYSPTLLAHLQQEIPRSIASADGIIAISDHTQRDLLARYPQAADRARIIHQGLRPEFLEPPSASTVDRILERLAIVRPYLLILSNHAPHKNTEFAIEAFAGWLKKSGNTTHTLVVAGGGPAPHAATDLARVVSRCGLDQRVRLVGRIARQDLPALYAGAAALLFPSLYEGWGLPPLEAMSLGTPAIVSNRGGLPEAVGDAAVVVPVENTQPWVDAIGALIANGPSAERRLAMRDRCLCLGTGNGQLIMAALTDALGRRTTRTSIVTAPTTTVTSTDRAIRLSGCMIIKNGVTLGYPFVEAILAAIDHVDEMVVVDGASDDDTWPVLERMAAVCPALRIERWPWPATTVGGRVIAEATNAALARCRGTHILCIQADEIHARANLVRLRELLALGYDCAAMPFLHFRSSWWKVIANPAYDATIRCVPNRPGVASVDDGTTFHGPLGRCAPPEEFSDAIFHVGWVYAPNIIQKHQNHAAIYTDHASYQRKAERARTVSPSTPDAVAGIDDDYQLLWFRGKHPLVIAHLIDQPAYDPAPGLNLWQSKYATSVPRTVVTLSAGGLA